MRKMLLVVVIWQVMSGVGDGQGRPVLQPNAIYINERKGDWVDFDIDYGAFRIDGAQAYVGKTQEGQWQRVRLPAAVSKAGRSWEAYDFVDEQSQTAVHQALRSKLDGRKIGFVTPYILKEKGIVITSLKPEDHRKGDRLATGELWIAGAIAIKFTLNKSKWSDDPEHYWVGFSGRWVKEERVWHDVFILKEKKTKKMIDALVRKAYVSRYVIEASF